jgi:hypothetical protein
MDRTPVHAGDATGREVRARLARRKTRDPGATTISRQRGRIARNGLEYRQKACGERRADRFRDAVVRRSGFRRARAEREVGACGGVVSSARGLPPRRRRTSSAKAARRGGARLQPW